MGKSKILKCGTLAAMAAALGVCSCSQRQSFKEQTQVKKLSHVTHADVDVYTKNWDADAEDDGIIIYFNLLDRDDDTVKFKGIDIPLEIRIIGRDYKVDRTGEGTSFYLLLNKQLTVSNYEDISYWEHKGIRVPFEEFEATPGNLGSLVYVAATLPDGKRVEAKDWFTK